MQESSRRQTRETEINPVDDDWEVQRRGLGLCCPGRLPGRGGGARALKDDKAVEVQRAEKGLPGGHSAGSGLFGGKQPCHEHLHATTN